MMFSADMTDIFAFTKAAEVKRSMHLRAGDIPVFCMNLENEVQAAFL